MDNSTDLNFCSENDIIQSQAFDLPKFYNENIKKSIYKWRKNNPDKWRETFYRYRDNHRDEYNESQLNLYHKLKQDDQWRENRNKKIREYRQRKRQELIDSGVIVARKRGRPKKNLEENNN